jgi:hypothetical protein
MGGRMQLTEDPARRQLIREVERGPRRQGQAEYLKFLRGQYCTRQELIAAKCYDCAGFYQDGASSCENKQCPLFRYHPYRKSGGD